MRAAAVAMFLVGCRGAVDSTVEDVGRYHLSAYAQVQGASAHADSFDFTLGAEGERVGAASLHVERAWSSGSYTSDIEASYDRAGILDGVQWSGASLWQVDEDDGEAISHTLEGTLELDGSDVSVSLSLWSEAVGETVEWYAEGSLGDELISERLLETQRRPVEDEDTEGCRTAASADCG